jgi:ABC-type polysaccharide/polyol phosphate transport system ATPase subunit
MISVRHLNKSYKTRFGTNHVLNDVSFDLAKGEKLGVLGRNGAGKSTLVRLISGSEQPSSGTIDREMSVSWPLAFGGAFQVDLTGQDNVRFISRIYNQNFKQNITFVEDFAELGPFLREPVRSYSSGMRARLAFAISMIIEFDCFLIDEVGAVGDARFHERCNFELFEKRADRAMIIISHNSDYMRDHCNRWALLDRGQMVHFNDFDQANDRFLQVLGTSNKVVVPPHAFTQRRTAIEALRRVAFADDHFIALVRRADQARDRHNWPEAESYYIQALALHPYESSYWAQLGNTCREQGNLERAEIAYRTACAYGESPNTLRHFIEAVNPAAFDDPRRPVGSADSGPTNLQAPGFPDLALLAGLFQGCCRIDEATALSLLRTGARIEELVAEMTLDDPSNESSGPVIPDKVAVVLGAPILGKDWIIDLCRLTGADHARLSKEMHSGTSATLHKQDLVSALLRAGGFTGWNVGLSSQPPSKAGLARNN